MPTGEKDETCTNTLTYTISTTFSVNCLIFASVYLRWSSNDSITTPRTLFALDLWRFSDLTSASWSTSVTKRMRSWFSDVVDREK